LKEADQGQKAIQQTDPKLSASSPTNSNSNTSVQTPFTLLSPESLNLAISTQPTPTNDIILQNTSLTGTRSSSSNTSAKSQSERCVPGLLPYLKNSSYGEHRRHLHYEHK